MMKKKHNGKLTTTKITPQLNYFVHIIKPTKIKHTRKIHTQKIHRSICVSLHSSSRLFRLSVPTLCRTHSFILCLGAVSVCRRFCWDSDLNGNASRCAWRDVACDVRDSAANAHDATTTMICVHRLPTTTTNADATAPLAHRPHSCSPRCWYDRPTGPRTFPSARRAERHGSADCNSRAHCESPEHRYCCYCCRRRDRGQLLYVFVCILCRFMRFFVVVH